MRYVKAPIRNPADRPIDAPRKPVITCVMKPG